MMGPLEQDREILSLVGAGLATWTTVEMTMSALFTYVSDMPARKATALFDNIISFEVRLGVLNKMMEIELPEQGTRKVWGKTSKRMEKLYKRRHRIAHFMTKSLSQGTSIIPFPSAEAFDFQNEWEELSKAQILEMIDHFREMDEALKWFTSRAWQRRRPHQAFQSLSIPTPPLIERYLDSAFHSPADSQQDD